MKSSLAKISITGTTGIYLGNSVQQPRTDRWQIREELRDLSFPKSFIIHVFKIMLIFCIK